MDPKAALRPGQQPFRLGEFLVVPQRNRVEGPGQASSLEPRVMDVLCALAARPGEVVTRAELIEQLWGVEFGGDESLTRAVSQLRKVFADSPEQPRVIETIPKRGYRLIAPVGAAETGAPAPAAARLPRPWLLAAAAALLLAVGAGVWLLSPRPAPGAAERTGVVLSVRAFESDGVSAEGFAEQLSAAIAKSSLIRATADDDAPDAPGAMRYALLGDIRRAGANVRVNAQLIDAASREVLWSENYQRAYDAQFSARDALAGAVAEEVQLPLLRAVKQRLEQAPILSLAPWQLTLLVTWVPGAEARPPGPPQEDSFWLQRRALSIDPNFAPAHALFAELAAYHALFHPPSNTPAALARARDHAERAIQLAPYDAEVLYQVALYYRFVGDRDRAAATFARVLELDPHHPLARVELAFVRGHCTAGAAAAIEQLNALQADMSASNPARWVALEHVSELYLSMGDYAAAKDAATRSRQIVPMTWTAVTLAAADAALGDRAGAAAVLDQHRHEWPQMDMADFAREIAPRWCLGGTRIDVARAAFARLAEPPPAQR